MTTDYTYSRSTILEALRVINEFVVSIDRLDRIAYDHGEEAWKQEVVRFLFAHEIDSKMATVRKSLSEPFSTDLGDGDMDDLERALQDTPHWTYAEFQHAQQSVAETPEKAHRAEESLQPIRIPGGWVIEFNDLYEVEASAESYERGFLKEDLLQLRHMGTDVFIDVGWYGGPPPAGRFGIHVYEHDFTGHLLEKRQTSSRSTMAAILEELLLRHGKNG